MTGSTGTTTKHKFQSWELNGRGKVKGVWPIAAELQPDIYTEVEVDTRGTVVGVREFRDGCPEPLIRAFHYDRFGRLEYQDYQDPLTGILGRNNYEYDKGGRLIARNEVDTHGKLRYQMEVRTDDAGRFVEEKIYDYLKRPQMRHVYSFDGSGNLVKDETWVGKKFETLQGFHTLTYDEKNHILRRAWHNAEGKEVNAFTYVYDQYDRRVQMAIETNGVKTTTCITEFDPLGKKVSSRYVDAQGKKIGSEGIDPDKPLPTVAEIANAVNDTRAKLAEAGKKDPKKLEALSRIAYNQFETGRYDEARKLFESLVALDPKNVYYLAGVAATALQQEQPQAALNYYNRALHLDPKHTNSLVGKADALLRLGKVDEALKALEALIKNATSANDPAIRRARAMVAAICQNAPKPGEAKANITQASPSKPAIPKASPSQTGIPKASPSQTGIPKAGPSASRTNIPTATASRTNMPIATLSSSGLPTLSPSKTNIPKAGGK